MIVLNDSHRETRMKAAIEAALNQVAARPGAPSFVIRDWVQGEAEPELHVVVAGKPRVLEVSQPFLEDEPDGDALRKISTAASQLVEGDAPRVQLFHRGVFAAWGLARDAA